MNNTGTGSDPQTTCWYEIYTTLCRGILCIVACKCSKCTLIWEWINKVLCCIHGLPCYSEDKRNKHSISLNNLWNIMFCEEIFKEENITIVFYLYQVPQREASE